LSLLEERVVLVQERVEKSMTLIEPKSLGYYCRNKSKDHGTQDASRVSRINTKRLGGMRDTLTSIYSSKVGTG
jgi:hypothetical protein